LANINTPQTLKIQGYIKNIIAKILAVRIKPSLSKFISTKQFDFLEGRHIHEAIRTTQEGPYSIKLSKDYAVVLKLDLSKAYDRVSWIYLRLLLMHIGFSYPIVEWITTCHLLGLGFWMSRILAFMSNMKRASGASLKFTLLGRMRVVATSLLRDRYHHSSKFQFCSFIVSTYFII
jgi:hypothetical protein